MSAVLNSKTICRAVLQHWAPLLPRETRFFFGRYAAFMMAGIMLLAWLEVPRRPGDRQENAENATRASSG